MMTNYLHKLTPSVSRLLLALIILAGVALTRPQSTLAADDPTPHPVVAPVNVTEETFNQLNPLVIGNSKYKTEFSTPAGIINRALVFAFPIAGLILFVMIVWGGFEMLSGSATKKSMDVGQQRVTAALIGFFLLFSSYWIVQIISAVFGVKIF